MSATDPDNQWRVAQQTMSPSANVDHERTLTLDLVLSEAEALRTWLLKPAKGRDDLAR